MISHPFEAQAFRPTKCVHCAYAPEAHPAPEEPCCTCGDQAPPLGCDHCAVTPESCRKAGA